MKKVACFFGTFDPVHIAHLIIAQHVKEAAELDEVWMVISPLNPFKQDRRISDDKIRLRMMKSALIDADGIYASDFEFDLPVPSYTVDSLSAMRERYPEIEFSLIMGSDNLAGFQQWKKANEILEDHSIWVYPRPGLEEHLAKSEMNEHPKVQLIKAPILEISATAIRNRVKEGKAIQFLTTEGVIKIIQSENLYSI